MFEADLNLFENFIRHFLIARAQRDRVLAAQKREAGVVVFAYLIGFHRIDLAPDFH